MTFVNPAFAREELGEPQPIMPEGYEPRAPMDRGPRPGFGGGRR